MKRFLIGRLYMYAKKANSTHVAERAVEFVQEENCGLVARSLAEIPSMTAEVLSEPLNFAYPSIYGTERIGQLIIKNTA